MAATEVIAMDYRLTGQQMGSAVPYNAATGQITAQVSWASDTDASQASNHLTLSIMASYDGGKNWNVLAGPSQCAGGVAGRNGALWSQPALMTTLQSGQQAPTHITALVDIPQNLSYSASILQS